MYPTLRKSVHNVTKQNRNGHMAVYILYPTKRFIAKRQHVNFFRSNPRPNWGRNGRKLRSKWGANWGRNKRKLRSKWAQIEVEMGENWGRNGRLIEVEMGENFQRGATRGTLRGNGAVTFFCGREAAAKKCIKHPLHFFAAAKRPQKNAWNIRKSCHAGT